MHVHYEDETTKHNEDKQVNCSSTSPDDLSPRRRKKKSQKHKRRKDKANGHVDAECEENGKQMLHKLEGEKFEEEENEDAYVSDRETQLPSIREKRKKKKRHKKRVESPFSQEDEESDKDANVEERTLESDDISSMLPPPRKLPPLKANSPIKDEE